MHNPGVVLQEILRMNTKGSHLGQPSFAANGRFKVVSNYYLDVCILVLFMLKVIKELACAFFSLSLIRVSFFTRIRAPWGYTNQRNKCRVSCTWNTCNSYSIGRRYNNRAHMKEYDAL